MRRVGLVVITLVVVACAACGGSGQAHHVYRFPGESMQPALKMNQRFTIQPVTRVHRGEIVALHAPQAFSIPPNTSKDRDLDLVVRRIIGLPGETIEGRAGRILINGRVLREPYLGRSARSRTFGPVAIPRRSYFVLGDNRVYSKDSTFYGPLPARSIAGRVDS